MTIEEVPGIPRECMTVATTPNGRIILTGAIDRDMLPALIEWLQIQAHPACPYTQSHTQTFCGNPRCRVT